MAVSDVGACANAALPESAALGMLLSRLAGTPAIASRLESVSYSSTRDVRQQPTHSEMSGFSQELVRLMTLLGRAENSCLFSE